jgi:predicted phosphate transport protein (TIGR00153 family)
MSKNKDFNYFKAFVNLSNFSLKAAEILNTNLHEFDKHEIEEKSKEMHAIEHAADLDKHEIMNRLVKEFLPPIEREDITSLSEKIDDVVDAIEDVLIGIDIFNVQAIRPEIIKFTELIMNCCQSMNSALIEFENFKKSKTLHAAIIEVNNLEEDGDALYINGMRNLYRSTKDPIELMVWSEIYRRLEKCCDCCEKVANDIENIVMKNS